MKLNRMQIRRLVESVLDESTADTAHNQRKLAKDQKMSSMKAVMEIPEFYRLVKFYEDFGPDFHESYRRYGDPERIARAFHESTMGMGTDEGKMAAALVSMKIDDISQDSVEQAFQRLSQQDSSIMIDDYDSLREAIEKENSGDTQQLLLDLLDGNIKITTMSSGGGRTSAGMSYRTDQPYINVKNRDGSKRFTLYHEGNQLGIDYVSLGDRSSSTIKLFPN